MNKNVKITILGSCRQEPISNEYHVTSIKNNISYPHSTKEIIEVINFCKYGNMTPKETTYTLRSGIINKKPILFSDSVKSEFESSNVFIVEISSRKTFKYKDRYVHHILYDDKKFNKGYQNDIFVNTQSDSEIEEDIIIIKKELNGNLIIVSHIVEESDINSSRYKLVLLLRELCRKHDIIFLEPSEEFKKIGYSVNNLVIKEPIIAHYNKLGNRIIQSIYKKYIDSFIKIS